MKRMQHHFALHVMHPVPPVLKFQSCLICMVPNHHTASMLVWKTIVFHYLPSRSSGTPNVRTCYSESIAEQTWDSSFSTTADRRRYRDRMEHARFDSKVHSAMPQIRRQKENCFLENLVRNDTHTPQHSYSVHMHPRERLCGKSMRQID